jgi:hypothetical protein
MGPLAIDRIARRVRCPVNISFRSIQTTHDDQPRTAERA